MNTPLPTSIGRPATKALGAVNISSLEDLRNITENELANLHGVGPKAIGILKQYLDENKMRLASADTLFATIKNDLLDARKQRDLLRSQALLSLVNAIDNAGAVEGLFDAGVTEVPRRELTVDNIQKIIQDEIGEMHEARAMYGEVNNAEAAELKAKITILKKYEKYS